MSHVEEGLDRDLLPRCLRRRSDAGLRAVLGELDRRGWSRLAEEAEWHGVAPLLHARLSDSGATPPDEVRTRLRDAHVQSVLRSRATLEQLAEVLDALSEAGVQALALKGAYLATCAYAAPELRPMWDIDLLVRHEGEAKAVEALESRGYSSAPGTEEFEYEVLHHLRPLVRNGGFFVELHRGLAPADAPFQVDIGAIFERASETRAGDLLLPHPAVDDVLLHVCSHAAYNDQFRVGLRSACDIDALVRTAGETLDWERFVRTAGEDGRARFCYVALALARTLLETSIPASVMSSLYRGEEDDEVTRDVVAYALDTEGSAPEAVRSVADASGLAAKAAEIWRGLFPGREKLCEIYGVEPSDPRRHLYRLYRPVDLLWRRGRTLLEWGLRSARSEPARAKELRRRRIRAWAREESGSAV